MPSPEETLPHAAMLGACSWKAALQKSEVLLETEMNRSQERALAAKRANALLSCIRRNAAIQ